MSTSTWKYNKGKHSVEEQSQFKPLVIDDYKTAVGKWLSRATEDRYYKELDAYNKYLVSLRSIPVSGTVDWKDGEDVTGKFDIVITEITITNNNIPPEIKTVARPIKQEQPQQLHEEVQYRNKINDIISSNLSQKGEIDAISALLRSNQSQEQPKQEAIEDKNLESAAEYYVNSPYYDKNGHKGSFKAGWIARGGAIESDGVDEVMGICVKANYYLTMNHTKDFRNEMDKLNQFTIIRKNKKG